ncbi:MAG: alpha-amylase, partial [Spirulina sp.]
VYDLGEFEQKGTIRTKYGTKDQYVEAIATLRNVGIRAYGDVVLNHRMGGDETEIVKATPYSQDDRLHPSDWMRDIKAYTHFTFPGRQKKYSEFEWHWWHFDAVDYDDYTQEQGTVYLLEGKQFEHNVALEKGNFDYLMGCDIDFQHPEVQAELIRWGKWYLAFSKVTGFRLDAVKHISSKFFLGWFRELAKFVTESYAENFFIVSEYWQNDIGTLHWYLDEFQGKMSVFDVPLHYNFHYASKAGGNYDMRRIFDNTLMQQRPTCAVTLVENHDSQPLQALESCVEPWFKPLAYAMILLREQGYPCIFYADYYGAEYEDYGSDGNRYRIYMPSHRWLIDKFLYARKHYAHGPQYDYLDHFNTIGWTRLGDEQHPKAMAVILSDGAEGSKWMEVGKSHAKFIDLTEHIKDPVYTNEWGWGEFRCHGGSVSVWIQD